MASSDNKALIVRVGSKKHIVTFTPEEEARYDPGIQYFPNWDYLDALCCTTEQIKQHLLGPSVLPTERKE